MLVSENDDETTIRLERCSALDEYASHAVLVNLFAPGGIAIMTTRVINQFAVVLFGIQRCYIRWCPRAFSCTQRRTDAFRPAESDGERYP